MGELEAGPPEKPGSGHPTSCPGVLGTGVPELSSSEKRGRSFIDSRKGAGGGATGGGASGEGGAEPQQRGWGHCTGCSFAPDPESCGFMTSGSSGGLEKESMRSGSKASSGEGREASGPAPSFHPLSATPFPTQCCPWPHPLSPSPAPQASPPGPRKASPTVAGAWGRAVWLVNPQSPNVFPSSSSWSSWGKRSSEERTQASVLPGRRHPNPSPRNPGIRGHLVEPLLLGGPLEDPLHDALELVDGAGLFGVREDGRLVPPDHEEDVLRGTHTEVTLAGAWGDPYWGEACSQGDPSWHYTNTHLGGPILG